LPISIDRDAPSFGLFVALREFLKSSEETGIGYRATVDRSDTVILRSLQVLLFQLPRINEIPDWAKAIRVLMGL
jgi:hypothetical protein